MSKDNTVNKITRESDGEKPSYEELEDAYIMERTKREQFEKAFYSANYALAKIKLDIKRAVKKAK